MKSPGFLGGQLLIDRHLTFWTSSVWSDLESMRKFRNSGAHQRTMPKLAHWCCESSAVHWEQNESSVPGWLEAHKHMIKEGRESPVERRSDTFNVRTIPAPRTATWRVTNLRGSLKALLLFVCALSIADLSFSTSKFVPPEGKVLLIVGQDTQNISAYLDAIKIVPAGLSAYTSAEFSEGLDRADDNGGGVQHAEALVKQYPNTVVLLAIYMVDMEEKIYSGDLDQSLDRIGNWIKSAKRPVYVRIGYEFDFPGNHYDPEKYVRAYRTIVDHFRSMGVDNAAYVWHSYANTVNRPHMDWFPGDDYVDWFAISYFDQPHTFMDQFVQLAKNHKKPLMIAEASPWFLSTSKSDEAWTKWFVPFFAFIRENDIKAISYINCDWDKLPLFVSEGWGDSRVQSNDLIEKKWGEEISKDRYLKSSMNLFRQLGFQK
jgi:hypothetical protein